MPLSSRACGGLWPGKQSSRPQLPRTLPPEGPGNSTLGVRRNSLCGSEVGLCRQRPTHHSSCSNATPCLGPGPLCQLRRLGEVNPLQLLPLLHQRQTGRPPSFSTRASWDPQDCGGWCDETEIPVGGRAPTDALLSSNHPDFWTFDHKSHLLNAQRKSFSISVNGNFIPSVAPAKTLDLTLSLFLRPHSQSKNPISWIPTYSRTQSPRPMSALASLAQVISTAFYLLSLPHRAARA